MFYWQVIVGSLTNGRKKYHPLRIIHLLFIADEKVTFLKHFS